MLALLTRSPVQRMPGAARYVHQTQRVQAAGRIHPVKNMRPGPSGCQSNALIASNDDDRGEDDGRVDDGVGAPASGAGTVSADMRARIGPAVDAKCSHPKGINDLLTITIY